jgi:hypothetical protein
LNYGNDDHEREPVVWFKTEYLLIALLGILYIALIGRYRPFELDNSWFLSFSHSFWTRRIETDTFTQQVFPMGGMGGVIAFGKLAAVVQGAILNCFGWSLTAATLISITFILLSLALLANTCRRLGYSANYTLCFIALLGFTEPFVAVSQKARYEFLPIFLLSLALWFAVREHIGLSIFVAALAAEVEPAAIVIPFAVATFLISRNVHLKSLRTPRLILRILLGASAAATVYFLFHPHIFSLFRSADWSALKNGGINPLGGFVTAYYAGGTVEHPSLSPALSYLVRKRHTPEFALLIASVVVCIFGHKKHLLAQWPALCILVILLLSTLLRWPNPAYFAFMAPFSSFFIMQALYGDRYRNWILAAILLFTLPQYVYRYHFWSSRDAGFSQYDENQINAAITREATLLGKSPQQLNLIGNYTLWFAHPDLFVDLNKAIVNNTMLGNADMLLCFDQPLDPLFTESTAEVPCGALNHIHYKQAETITLHGHVLRVLIPTHQP